MTGVSLGLLLTALTLSTVSAYYSIVGLAAIFAASFWPVLILATTLEVGKLVMVSWLYRNWRDTPWPIRTYLTVAVIILMAITSLGIFGFLSKAHSEDQVQAQQIQLQVNQINNQIEVRQQQLSESREVVSQLNRSINIQLDANRAQQALANRRQQTAERERVQARMDQLQAEILQLSDQKAQLMSVRNVQESKLGPIRYVVALINPDADPEAAVKWIILVLVLVCDPLAVCMLMAANQGYKNKLTHESVPQSSPSNVKWDPTEHKLLISDQQGMWHAISSPAPVQTTTDTQVADTVKLVEMAVSELIKQRPIWEMVTMCHAPARTHVIHTPDQEPVSPAEPGHVKSEAHTQTPAPIDPEAMQKLIEQTLESWMNRTLTVTYSADQTEIDRIVEKVIQQTMQKSQDTPPEPTEQNTTLPEPPGHTSEPPEVDITYDDAPSSPTTETASTDVASGRPIYNYFGEERVRGGGKHNIHT
jgi:hypothetical protein